MAGGGGGGQQGGQGDNTYNVLWILGLIALVGGVIWFFLQDYLKIAFIAIKTVELSAIYYPLSWIPPDLPWIGPYLSQAMNTLSADLEVARQITPETLNADIAVLLAEESGSFLRWPAALVFAGLAYGVFKTNVFLRLRKKFNMKTLALQEQKNWPQIKIVTKLNLVDENIEAGPWAIGQTPMLFAKRNKILGVEFADNSNAVGPKNLAPEFKAVLDKTRAELLLSMQLGRTWQGIENMAPHRRAVFAVFCARGCRDTKSAYNLVRQLSSSAAEGKLDCSGADDLWKKHSKDRKVQEICHEHAYELTVMISMLMFAREDGVLASSDFLWIKPLDRRFWYVINSTGRQTPLVEVAGIFSHWFSERALKKPLSVPMVGQAIEALEFALGDILYVPDEKERDELNKIRDEALSAKSPGHNDEILDDSSKGLG